MLPSKGFFKKNDCPFFEKGLCVRPHCHFRHRKKVLNDPSPEQGEEVEDMQENIEVQKALSYIDEQDNESVDKPCASTSDESNSKEINTTHDTLFAKLVNQSNTYEKIHRHIPCAYTPTPQHKKVEPDKKKTISGIASFGDSKKSMELITKARTLLKNYCEENIKKCENKSNGSNETKSDSKTNQSVSKEHSVSTTQGYECGNSIAKGKGCDIGVSSQCSKVTPVADISLKSTEINLSPDYIPEKKDLKEGELALTTSKDHSIYEPTPVTKNGERKTEKSSDLSVEESNENCENVNDELSELDLIRSEIEMMNKILSDNHSVEEVKEAEKDKISCEEKENKDKYIKEEIHSSSLHGTRHKSSKSHSSSSSKHTSRHSSRHSRSSSSSSRHHSSSSRHHSSSSRRRSSSSSRHRSSSSRHHSSSSRRRSSDRHSSSRHSRDHHSKKQSDKHETESERKKVSGSHRDSKRKNSLSHSRTSSSDEDGEEDEEEEEDDCGMEVDISFDANDNTDDVCSERSRKRKKIIEEDEQASKYILSSCEDMDEDLDAIEQECLEIFKNYDNASEGHISKNIQEIVLPNTSYESSVQGKKRTAHSTAVMSDHSALRHKTVKKKNNIKAAQELMFERYKIAEKAKEAQQSATQVYPAPVAGLSRPSIKIAAVSNIQQMLRAKKAIQEKINQGLKVNERTTIAHTVPPGTSRVAHVPKDLNLNEKPTITEGSKQVPRAKRQIYLEKLLIETNQIYPTKSESSGEALKLEQEIYTLHSGSTAAYHAAFVSLLMKTRRKLAALKGEKINTVPTKPKVSHFDILSGGKKNFSVIKTKKVDISMLSEKQIYDELLRFKLTEEELKANGFPMSSNRPGYAVCNLNFDLKYNEKYLYIKKITGNRRYCIRCSKLYDIDPKTLQQFKEGPETCSFHPGRKKSGGRNCERIYNCCNSSSTEGCTTHVRHVTDSNDYENYPNCVRTLAKDETNPGVYALDCEMVYSRLGTELARVTVVNLKKEIVYDTLVKPKYPVDCYNTLYSGIEEKMLEGVETTLNDVQAVLLSMFSNKTILIGHSLDSDLRALHLIHDTVVDTSIVYKNEKYFPSKYSLKELCAKKLSKIIQDNVNGHDSKEDAVAALEIMLQQVKEEVAKFDSLESYEADRGR